MGKETSVQLCDEIAGGRRGCQEELRGEIGVAIGARRTAGLQRVSRNTRDRDRQIVTYIQAWWSRAECPPAAEARASCSKETRSARQARQGFFHQSCERKEAKEMLIVEILR